MPDDCRYEATAQIDLGDRLIVADQPLAPGFEVSPSHISRLKSAALNPDRDAGLRALSALRENGIRDEDIADHYIPAVARDMGEAWCSDNMSFAAVTIGASRLQSWLRELGPEWTGDTNSTPDAPMVILVVADHIHHTLGAMVLAGQLRRRGISVRLMLNTRPKEITQRLCNTSCDALFISASQGETLESLRKIVDSVRHSAAAGLPVVIGGTILTDEPAILALTGANFATNDPDEALALCGLVEKPKIRPRPKRG